MAAFRHLEKKHVKRLIPKPKDDQKYPVLGSDIIKSLYSLIDIQARPGSGKTTLIFDMLNSKCGPKTTVIIFSGSADLDDNMIYIIDWLKENHIRHAVHGDLVDENDNSIIDAFKKSWDIQRMKDEEMKSGTGNLQYYDRPVPIGGSWSSEVKEVKEKKFYKTLDPHLVKIGGVTYEYPANILIFDDLGGKMRGKQAKELEKFAKLHRHYKSLMIFSTQDLVDHSPGLRNIIKDWFLFSDIDQKRLIEIYKSVGASISESKFLQLYNLATAKPHDYAHIDVKLKTMSKNDQEVASLKEERPPLPRET